MGLTLDRTIKLEKQFASWAINIMDNVERFYWSHDDMLKYWSKEILQNEDYRKLPRHSKSYIEGIREARLNLIWRHNVVFSYLHNGKRYLLGTEEYRKIPPQNINTDTGCYVWRDNPEKYFTLPE